MLQVGTHWDYNHPPNVPMFGISSKTPSKSTGLTEALTNVAEGFMRAIEYPNPTCISVDQEPPISSSSIRKHLNEMGVSPRKCASLHSQYIEQLKQLNQLLEATAIAKEEYDHQKAEILKKMQQL